VDLGDTNSKITRNSTQHGQGDKNKDAGRGTARNTHAGDEKWVQNFSQNT
jgi:hypothetical protein